MERFGRLITAMVTPFDEQGEVDYEQAKNLALALIESGSQGLVVSGTTGESPTLTHEEKLRLFAEVKAAIGARAHIIAGTGNYSTRESVELTKAAEREGVDGILAVVPYYNKPTQEGLYQHFKAIAECTSLPCIVYNVPSRTITNLTAETMIRLAEIDNIVGVKEASANYEQISKIIDGVPREFMVFSGNDSDTLPIMAMGGYGIVSVIGHLVGNQIREMMDDFVWGNADEAAKMHRHLLPLVNACFIVSNPIPVKYALNYVGFRVGKPRLPLTEPDSRSAKFIEETVSRYHIDLPLPLAH